LLNQLFNCLIPQAVRIHDSFHVTHLLFKVYTYIDGRKKQIIENEKRKTDKYFKCRIIA